MPEQLSQGSLSGMLKMSPKKMPTNMVKLWANRAISAAYMFDDSRFVQKYLLKAAQCELELHRRGEQVAERIEHGTFG